MYRFQLIPCDGYRHRVIGEFKAAAGRSQGVCFREIGV